MNPLLISGFGTSIFVDKRRLIVKNSLENKHFEFYPHQIDYDSIIIDGHTGNITFEAMRWIMKHNINLTLLNWNGNLLANTLPSEPKNGKLRILQYQKYLDDNARYEISKELIRQKESSSFNLLKELSRYYPEVDVKQIQTFEDSLKIGTIGMSRNDGKTVHDVMGREAVVASFYWDKMTKIFNKLYPEFRFKNRSNKTNQRNMNAADEVNALLNYGYGILESEVRKTLNTIGLDSTVGFLHEITAARTALVYDIQELFRWLIDLSVIRVLEDRKLKKSDFIVTENYNIRLRETAAKALIEKISLNFNRRAKYKGKNYSYQSILFDNTHQLANFIVGRGKHELEFVIPLIKIDRNDSLDVRRMILDMTPGQRKRLGINKSTLWYQKKNLAKGKKIKVYDKVLARLLVPKKI